MKSYFLLGCLILLIGSSTAPFASAVKVEKKEVAESDRQVQVSTIHDLGIQEGRILKRGKVKKPKAPVKKWSKSKSPQKQKCYTNEESGDFINALTSAADSGASSIELVICDGNTIDIPSPIDIYLESDVDSRLPSQRKPPLLSIITLISIICRGDGCAVAYTAGKTTGISTGAAGITSVIKFRRRGLRKANLAIFLGGISLASKSVPVGAFFDVSDIVKETATGTTFTVTMSGTYVVAEKVSTPVIYSNEGLPCDCDSCTPARV